MNRKITLFALAGCAGFLGAIGLTNGVDAIGGRRLACQEAVAAQKRRQGHRGEAAAGFPEELAARPAAELAAGSGSEDEEIRRVP